jgi:acetyl-CoA acetyltransferase
VSLARKEKLLVSISGWGQVGPVAEDTRSIPEMVLAAVEAALENSGLDYTDIDAVVTASVDLFDGLTASNIAVTEVVGAVMKPETRIAADGLCAAIHAACQINAGAYDTVLVVAHAKASISDYQTLTQWALDPIYLQPLGIDFLSCAGLQASAMAAGNERVIERWAEIAAQRRSCSTHGGERSMTAREVLESPWVATPLRADMCAPMGDGASACVLQRAAAGPASGGEIRITGVGHDLAPNALGDRDLTESAGLARACNRAYAMADITHPATELDLAEPSCIYPHEEDLFRQAAQIDQKTIISPRGGLFAGYVPVVAGLSRLIAAASYLQRNNDCRRAIAHGHWGPAGQGQAVAILERRRS